MRSLFSRTFFPGALILLLALGSVGAFFRYHTQQAMENRAFERLQVQAHTVSALASAYNTATGADVQDFYINLTVAARASGADTVICNAEGELLLCSDAPMGCDHQGLVIGQDYLQKAFSAEYTTDTGIIEGLYEDVRYVVSVPIESVEGLPIGLVISSSPVSDNKALLQTVTRNYTFSTITAMLLALAIMLLVTRKNTRSLRVFRDAAVSFGHGDLDARVEVDAQAPEEIEELSLAFNNMADSLKKSEYQRQQFVANVSHELKTPMTTIAGFADGILDGTIPPERQAHYLNLISTETKRLNRLVRSMLDISRLQDIGGIPDEQKTRFEVQECAGQVLLTFEQKINEKQLDVQVDMPDLPVYTRAHQDYIVQVIYNLLDNAVKYCPQSGILGLSVRTGGNKIYVSVFNSGPTVPQEELPLLFDRFHKLDKSRSESRDSWGLGLYIVKTIVCAHGEDISVDSRDGRTEFTFTLPLIC